MKTILLTNDDGYLAPGLQSLKERLRRRYRVYVVAPDRERSAVSMSLTIHHPLRMKQMAEDEFTIDGTPSDCVNVGLQKVVPRQPDFIVSGMNHGENLSEDVFYSGTVAAAFAGYVYRIPALAVSMVGNYDSPDSPPQFNVEQSAQIAADVLEKIMPLNGIDGVFNLNIPNPVKGETRITSLGFKHYKPSVVERIDPRGKPYYWIGTGQPILDGGADSDLRAIKEGVPSLSLLQYNLNCPEESQKLMEMFK